MWDAKAYSHCLTVLLQMLVRQLRGVLILA